MKGLKTAGIVVSVILCMSGLIGCGGTTSERAVTHLFNGYEDYYDLAWTSIHGDLFGEITINTDKDYISQGNGSAKFDLDYNNVYSSPDQNSDSLEIGTFKYELANYPDTFKWLDKIESLSIDIYNDSDYEYDLYFAAGGDESSFFFNDGKVLAANSWNYLTFYVKPYFFDKDTAVKDYIFYLDGVQNTPDKKAVLYVDNFRAEVYSAQAAPPNPPETDELSFGGIEILNFDDAGDMDFVLTKNSTKAAEFLPLFYAGYKAGYGLQVELNKSHRDGLIWETGNGYDIIVHKSVLSGIVNPRTVSLNCVNPSNVSHYVTLECGHNGKIVLVKKHIPAGGSVDIVLSEVNGFSGIDSVTIKIDSWKLTGKSSLQFTNLRYTV